MQDSLDAMKLALRVLTALTEHRHLEVDEVATLRALAGPKLQSMPLDELACEVIQAALKHRAAARGAGSSS
jgi:hypothetical protein